MTERERNKRFFLLINKLIEDNELEAIELLITMAAKDTPAMQKTCDIMTIQNLIYQDLISK